MGKNLSRISYRLTQSCLVGLLALLFEVNSQRSIAGDFAQKISPPAPAPTTDQPAASCPTDVKELTDLMLKSLPSYANRVMQRARQIDKNLSYSYVLIAGRPEFEPLALSDNPSQYPGVFPNTTEQIFFTTLERRYSNNKVLKMQLYHWLFLTPTPQGWQLFTLFTRIGSTVPGEPPLPPRESNEGVIGQAVSLWLRDCQEGTLRR